MLNDLLEEHDAIEGRIDAYTKKIDQRMAPWEEQLRLLTTIPGIDRNAASTILIEIGPDIGVFGSKERLAAWAGLCPGNNESGGKRRKAHTRMGSKTLRVTLVECAHGAARKGMPVRSPPPGACRPARLQARHRRRVAPRGFLVGQPFVKFSLLVYELGESSRIPHAADRHERVIPEDRPDLRPVVEEVLLQQREYPVPERVRQSIHVGHT